MSSMILLLISICCTFVFILLAMWGLAVMINSLGESGVIRFAVGFILSFMFSYIGTYGVKYLRLEERKEARLEMEAKLESESKYKAYYIDEAGNTQCIYLDSIELLEQ